jgi:hypothetical protein
LTGELFELFFAALAGLEGFVFAGRADDFFAALEVFLSAMS